MKLPHINLFEHRPHLGPDASRDWFTILGVVIVLLLVSVGGNFFFYHQAVSGKSLTGSSSSATTPVNADLLGKVEQVFSARATEETRYENGSYSFIDPSK